MADRPVVEKIERGLVFIVLVLKDYVLKVPASGKHPPGFMHEIATRHNAIAKDVPELLPYSIHEGYLIQERAKGTIVHRLSDKKRAYELKDRAKAKARKAGWSLRDTGDFNLFYDSKEDKLQIVDCHLSKKLLRGTHF